MTHLSAEYSEPLQIASYGLGGHYVPHYDWFGYRRDVPERDRIATLMFYVRKCSFIFFFEQKFLEKFIHFDR